MGQPGSKPTKPTTPISSPTSHMSRKQHMRQCPPGCKQIEGFGHMRHGSSNVECLLFFILIAVIILAVCCCCKVFKLKH